tara:strand:- start:1207 stop:1350 length:144 start_codon:yes stop_codon:yes gene_type:complete
MSVTKKRYYINLISGKGKTSKIDKGTKGGRKGATGRPAPRPGGKKKP